VLLESPGVAQVVVDTASPWPSAPAPPRDGGARPSQRGAPPALAARVGPGDRGDRPRRVAQWVQPVREDPTTSCGPSSHLPAGPRKHWRVAGTGQRKQMTERPQTGSATPVGFQTVAPTTHLAGPRADGRPVSGSASAGGRVVSSGARWRVFGAVWQRGRGGRVRPRRARALPAAPGASVAGLYSGGRPPADFDRGLNRGVAVFGALGTPDPEVPRGRKLDAGGLGGVLVPGWLGRGARWPGRLLDGLRRAVRPAAGVNQLVVLEDDTRAVGERLGADRTGLSHAGSPFWCRCLRAQQRDGPGRTPRARGQAG
jgi:hypothetical protein